MKFFSEIVIHLEFEQGSITKETGRIYYNSNPKCLRHRFYRTTKKDIVFIFDGNGMYTRKDKSFEVLKASQILTEIESNIYNEIYW